MTDFVTVLTIVATFSGQPYDVKLAVDGRDGPDGWETAQQVCAEMIRATDPAWRLPGQIMQCAPSQILSSSPRPRARPRGLGG